MFAASEFAPDFTIISAGFDAARGDPLGCCDVRAFLSVVKSDNSGIFYWMSAFQFYPFSCTKS